MTIEELKEELNKKAIIIETELKYWEDPREDEERKLKMSVEEIMNHISSCYDKLEVLNDIFHLINK